MNISAGQSTPLAYPRFQPGFTPRTAVPNNYSIDMAEKAFPAAEFSYLNLRGLAGVEDLSVQIITKLSEKDPDQTYHDFIVHRRREGYNKPGRIDLFESTKSSGAMITTLYPNLPQSSTLGKGLGRTLLFLILTRGNAFVGKEVELNAAKSKADKMAEKMTSFFPRIQHAGDEPHGSAFLIVPELSNEQLTAVEWYWENILHCPAS